MQFHIVHFIPHPNVHGLYGYAEVIETLAWALNELGHEVSAGADHRRTDRTNILLGGHMLEQINIDLLAPDTIIYNLEQLAGHALRDLLPSIHELGKRFRIWDFCELNLPVWKAISPNCNPVLMPIGFAPVLRRVPKRSREDIDVLFYGLPSAERLKIFNELCERSLRCVFACGLYGPSRDELISNAKIILNINKNRVIPIFEVVRVSYLLANAKAVVSDIYPDSFIEPDLRDAVAFAPLEGIAAECERLVKDDLARRQLEERGSAIFARRDMREIVRKALIATSLA